jgi:copper chaperone
MNATEQRESRTYAVVGMTCSHCTSSVREAVSELAGVHAVDVDLDSGRLVVHGHDFADDAVKDAVQHAGYELASGPSA